MVSLRTLRDSLVPPRQGRGDYQLAEALLKAIRDHAVLGSSADRERFQSQLGDLNRRFVGTDDDAELLMVAGAARQALRLYETETNAYWANRTAELQTIAATSTRALRDFSQRHSEATACLTALEASLVSLSRVEDLRAARQQLEDCIATLRIENQRQKETRAMLVRSLPPRSESPADPVTGLASRQAAEDVIADRLQLGASGTHLALFVVHRIQQINARYGHAVGDDLLRTFLHHLTLNLRPGDALYRWSGPAFLAIVQREDPLDAVVLEMRRVGAYKLDRELEIGDRSVMVPLSASVCLVALTAQSQRNALSAELDQFVNLHLQR